MCCMGMHELVSWYKCVCLSTLDNDFKQLFLSNVCMVYDITDDVMQP